MPPAKKPDAKTEKAPAVEAPKKGKLLTLTAVGENPLPCYVDPTEVDAISDEAAYRKVFINGASFTVIEDAADIAAVVDAA